MGTKGPEGVPQQLITVRDQYRRQHDTCLQPGDRAEEVVDRVMGRGANIKGTQEGVASAYARGYLENQTGLSATEGARKGVLVRRVQDHPAGMRRSISEGSAPVTQIPTCQETMVSHWGVPFLRY